MFGFITRKYKDEIKNLKNQISNMNWEWNKEKELYDDAMITRVYEQKVDWTIRGLDIRKIKEIHRPICGLDKTDALMIANMVKHRLKEQGINSETSYHWRESDKCYVIDVKVRGDTMKLEDVLCSFDDGALIVRINDSQCNTIVESSVSNILDCIENLDTMSYGELFKLEVVKFGFDPYDNVFCIRVE